MGLNRFVIHTSVHQPLLDKVPGLGLGPFGLLVLGQGQQVRKLGAQRAVNYKTEDVGKALRSHCPDGIDIDFENVGGTIMEAVLDNLKLNARIVLCGMISQYNEGSTAGPRNFGSAFTASGGPS